MHHSRSEGKTATRPGGREPKTLGSRFRPPRMLFTAIDRPFPLSKIRDGLARQIVVVHAPSGFGKTALLKAGYEAVTSGSDYFQSLFDGGETDMQRLTVCGLTYLRERDGSNDPVKAGYTGL